MAVRRPLENVTSGTFVLGPIGATKRLPALSTDTIVGGTLSARVYWSAYTNLMTLTGKWEGSNNNGTTYREIKPMNNAAHVVLQTSTGTGAVYIEAPRCISGFTHVRFALVSGVASGTAADAYTMSYGYVQKNSFEPVFSW